MNNEQHSPAGTNAGSNPPAGGAPKKFWFVSGLVLWIVALVMLYRTFQPRQPENGGADPGQDVLVLDDSHSGKSKSQGTGEGDTAHADPSGKVDLATATWDPDGIEDFSLTERSGRTITKADLLGHDWIVGFIFIDCAGPCPRVTAQMHDLQRQLKETDVRLVTITVNPKVDTPERLERYAKSYEADPERWLFLTGEMEKIYHLIGHSFKMPVKEMQGEDRKPGYEVLHTMNLLHVNPEGVVVGKYNALSDTEMAQLRQKIKGK